jgi:hypothetical protein
MNPTAFRQPYEKDQLWRLAGKMVVCRKQGYQEKIYRRTPEIIKNIKRETAGLWHKLTYHEHPGHYLCVL